MKQKSIQIFFLVLLTIFKLAYGNTLIQQKGQWSGDIYCGSIKLHDQSVYIYDSNQLVIVDVTDPENPQKLGEITLPMDIIDLHVTGQFVYAATSFGYYSEGSNGNNDHDGMRIIDISNPESPREVGFYHKFLPKCIYVSGQYAYLGTGNLNEFYSGSLDIIDINVPSSPRLIGQHSGDAIEDIITSNGMTYAVFFNPFRLGATGGILAIDSSDPASPKELSRFTTYQFIDHIYDGDALPRAITKANNLLFLTTDKATTEGDNQLFILDITDPNNIEELSTYNSTDSIYSHDITGVYLYLASGNDLKIVDISNPSSPLTTAASYNDGAPQGVSVSGDYAYVAKGNEGFVILNTATLNSPPLGTFETPEEGDIVAGSIPVSGWVLDDKEIDNVKIYRNPISGENNSLVYLGEAVLVEGARPDVQNAYPAYPMNSQAGWGYMLLTNYNMPNQGNGAITLVAVATDNNGAQTTLGSKVITLDNANSTQPFGAIDTPAQGGSASGNQYINWGWALTPQPNTIPFDGSTINVFVDGKNLGHPVYNLFRKDIADYFPGYNNTNGAVGYFYLDTTQFENGIHTIAWVVQDNAGNIDGIGSRYFSINNPTGFNNSSASSQEDSIHKGKKLKENLNLKVSTSSLKIRKGFSDKNPMQTYFPDYNGVTQIEIHELQRLEIHLKMDVFFNHSDDYTRLPELLSEKPVGSYFDKKKGIFYWQPGPGIIGTFDLKFLIPGIEGETYMQKIQVKIRY